MYSNLTTCLFTTMIISIATFVKERTKDRKVDLALRNTNLGRSRNMQHVEFQGLGFVRSQEPVRMACQIK